MFGRTIEPWHWGEALKAFCGLVPRRFKWRNTYLQPSLPSRGLHSLGLLPGAWRRLDGTIHVMIYLFFLPPACSFPILCLFFFFFFFFLYWSQCLLQVIRQYRCRHPGSTQSAPESGTFLPLAPRLSCLCSQRLSPGWTRFIRKDAAAAIPPSRGPAGQMVQFLFYCMIY